MKETSFYFIVLTIFILSSCSRNENNDNREIEIPDFNFPKTVEFEQKLSAYNIFKNTPSNLIPSDDFHLLELSSILFTDYAQKQRLVKIPEGTQLTKLDDGSIDYPDGTILTKTFFYYNDERDTSLGKRIIETRLLIKESNTWNVATYIWNEEQTEATIQLNGLNTEVNFITSNGKNYTTTYHVPTENECMACHQVNSSMSPIGPTLRNLNRDIERNNSTLNQITHLQSMGILNDFQIDEVSSIIDYTNESQSLEKRTRAYLDMNCAHCHNPAGWDKTEERDFDFRYELSLDKTGIEQGKDKITTAILEDGNMPLIGTTLLDKEGIELVTQYLNGL